MHMTLLAPAFAQCAPLPSVSTSTLERAASELEDTLAGFFTAGAERTGPRSNSGEMSELARQLTAPLGVASGYAEALGRETSRDGTERTRIDTARILSSCRQARCLLDGLLAIVRLQRSGPRAKRSVVDACEVLNAAARRNTPLLLDKSLALGAVSQGHAVLRVDRAALDSIIDNLLAALVPRLSCGAQIWTSFEREDTTISLRITVESEEPAPRQVGEAGGLAYLVATRIAKLLGGEVAVEEAHGAPRTWCVRLPV
jgi:signal transduction histidine kinase